LSKPVTGETLRTALQRFDMPHTILLIGGDRDVIRMLSRLLQAIKPPLTLLKAYSAEEGLALAGQQHPDVIILDSVQSKNGDMPVLTQLQADPVLKTIPILLMSAGDGDELTPAREGKILVRRTEGFQPIELVRCIEALVDAFTPANAPEFSETRSDSVAS
jgi:CheY-like chemotaxis protein